MTARPEWRHPELRDGEVFVGNFSQMGFNICGHTTKRRGRQAYYGDHTPYGPEESTLYFPVFAQRSELEDRGVEVKGQYNVGSIAPASR